MNVAILVWNQWMNMMGDEEKGSLTGLRSLSVEEYVMLFFMFLNQKESNYELHFFFFLNLFISLYFCLSSIIISYSCTSLNLFI